MAQVSAGLLMCKKQKPLMFFLVHPGGPFFIKKEEGAWTIPKGLVDPGEDLLAAAKREFTEETGLVPTEPYASLGTTMLKSGKLIHAWTFFGSWDESKGIVSNSFSLEWPPRSGTFKDFPEADRAAWMNYDDAKRLINPAQIVFLDRAKALFKG